MHFTVFFHLGLFSTKFYSASGEFYPLLRFSLFYVLFLSRGCYPFFRCSHLFRVLSLCPRSNRFVRVLSLSSLRPIFPLPQFRFRNSVPMFHHKPSFVFGSWRYTDRVFVHVLYYIDNFNIIFIV